MKRTILTILLSAAALGRVWAADNVSYTASDDPNLNPDGIATPGGPVDVWTVSHSGGGTAGTNYGSFLGNSASNGGGSGAGAGNPAWGLWADSTVSGNEIDMGHTFAGGVLSIGQTVSIDFDGGYADPNGEYGIRLFGPSGFVAALIFSGGDTYRYYDAGPGGTAGPGYDPNGFNFAFTLTGTTTYSAVITDGSGTIGSWIGTISGAPDFIQVHATSAGSDGTNGGDYGVFANNLAIVPEPGSLALVVAGIGFLLLALRRRALRA